MNGYAAAIFALGATLSLNAFAQNGGTTCATATQMVSGTAFTSDTTAAPNWMTSFGPLVSPSNDVVYTFVVGPDVSGDLITPVFSDYPFAIYLIPSCTVGAEPTPIGATATIAVPISTSRLSTPLIPGARYYLAVTGTAAGGIGANGTVQMNTPVAVTLQNFDVE